MIPKFITNPDPSIFIRGSPLYLDLETTNLDKGSPHNKDNRLLLACWNYKGKDYKQWGSEYEMGRLLSMLREADYIVAHNAKFELGWLKRMGVELRDILFYDTMLAEWVIAGNRNWELNLEACCERHGLDGKMSAVSEMIKAGVCPSEIPPSWLEQYCFQDVHAMIPLHQSQIRQASDMLGIIYQRGLVAACLADIEFEGLVLDKEKVIQEYVNTTEELVEVQEKLKELCGDISLTSSKQLGEFLYGELGFEELKKKGQPIRTKGGKPKTDKNTLLSLKATNKRQRQFVELYTRFNKLDSLLSKNLNFFHGVCRGDGKFYGEIRQGITATHRLAAGGRPIVIDGKKYTVQVQNLPREYKGLFTAPDGYLVGEADGAQLEFRGAAILANDKAAADDVRNNVDVHQQTADALTQAGEPTSRQDAKSVTFTPLYGGRGKTKAQQEYVKLFRQKYKDIARMQYKWTMDVVNTGKLESPYGLKFYWPGTKMSPDGYVDNTTQIYNYCVQGFATGEAFLCGMVWFWHRTRDLPIRLCLTVHDSIVAYVKRGYEKQFTEIAVQSLTHDVYYYLGRLYNFNSFPAPLGVGIKIASHWGKGEETKVDVPYDPTERVNGKGSWQD